jgi:RNA polymerase sigma-70 factor (sigma-B/F/G subfamily)
MAPATATASAAASTTTVRRTRHPHDDAPDTAAAFTRLAELADGPERETLRDDVVRAWMPMAHRLAGRFRNRGESVEDLRQVAAVGLVKAVDRYEPSRGSFESYAVPTIVGEIKRHFRDYTWDMHVPRRVQDIRNRVRTSYRELTLGLDDRSPTLAQLSEHSGLPEEDVLAGLEALQSYRSLSLDAELTTTSTSAGYSLLDTLGEGEPGYDDVVDREAVKPLLRALPERDKRVLYLRFFCDMTQKKIGEQLGISQMHVSRILSGTCDRLRRQVALDPRAHTHAAA